MPALLIVLSGLGTAIGAPPPLGCTVVPLRGHAWWIGHTASISLTARSRISLIFLICSGVLDALFDA